MPKRRGNNKGSIYQAKDGRWRAAVHVGFKNGKRNRKMLSGATRAEVAEKLKKALRDQQQGILLQSERQTLADYLPAWLASAKPKLRYGTYESYGILIKVHLVPGLGHIRLSKLNAQQVDDFLNLKRASGLSPRSVQYLHAVLRAALNQAVKWDLIVRNVVTLVETPKVPKHQVHPYTPAEAIKFLKAVSGHRLECLFTVAIACGLREGEALGLQLNQIDLEAATLSVRTQLQRNEKRKLALSVLKTEESRRVIDLPNICVESLKAHLHNQNIERQLAGTKWKETGLVFTTRVGTGIHRRNLLRIFYRIVDCVGLRRIRFHDLRHTAASLLLGQKVSMKAVQKILGHADIRTTMNIYGHLYEEERKDAASKMDAVLNPVATRLATGARSRKVQ